MVNIKSFDKFIIESFGNNEVVNQISKFIFNKISQELGKLIYNKRIVINNYLQNKKQYSEINFINDEIEIILSNRNYGLIKNVNIDNDKIKNLRLSLEIVLSPLESKLKTLNVQNRILTTIDHEFNHIIEKYINESNNRELTKSWKIGANLHSYREKYKNTYDKWDDILHFIYLSLPHEIRSRVSSLREELEILDIKNEEYEKYIKKTEFYIVADAISKMSPEFILEKMQNLYLNFDILLREFMTTVLDNFNENTEKEFIKYFKTVMKRNEKMKVKLLKTYYFIFEHDYTFFNYPDKNINYEEYLKITPEIIRKTRNKKLKRIFNP